MLLLHEWAALLLSVLAGLGVGSGGVFLILLTALVDVGREEGIFCNLLFFIAASLSSSVIHFRSGRLMLPFLLRILLLGIPGAYLGHLLGNLVPHAVSRMLLGVFLIFSGIFSLVLPKKKKECPKHS